MPEPRTDHVGAFTETETPEQKALVEGQPHKIEEAVRVYLAADFGVGHWVVDVATTDGSELFSEYDNGPLNEACECEGPPEDCEAHRQRAETEFDLPDGHELLLMLAKAYGYTLTPTT